MLELIKKLYVEEKKSIILSSHLLFDVQRVCDWVVILGRGRVIANGDVSQMLTDSSGTIRLKVAGNPELLVSRLKSRGIDAASEGQYVDVQRTENVEMQVLEEIQKERSLGLRYLGPRTRTLEDVFMSLVEGRSDME
jgi:ABC-2 type transport system ATP-binding protein